MSDLAFHLHSVCFDVKVTAVYVFTWIWMFITWAITLSIENKECRGFSELHMYVL